MSTLEFVWADACWAREFEKFILVFFFLSDIFEKKLIKSFSCVFFYIITGMIEDCNII